MPPLDVYDDEPPAHAPRRPAVELESRERMKFGAGKAEEVHEGRVEFMGTMERQDGRGRSYPQYGIDLFDERLQLTDRVWGADLQRCVQIAGVSIGDRIRVEFMGTRPLAGGKTKRLYQITKL